jgi:uncharacterized membrane protein YphA (DoxX/SURF4 family)
MDHYFREPFSAAVIAAAVVIAYVYVKAKMNKEKPKNSEYFKNGFLVGLLVYFIVSQGQGSHEPIMKEPF